MAAPSRTPLSGPRCVSRRGSGNLGGDLTEDRGPHVRAAPRGEGLPHDEAEVWTGDDHGYPRQAILDLELADRGLQPGERAGPRTR